MKLTRCLTVLALAGLMAAAYAEDLLTLRWKFPKGEKRSSPSRCTRKLGLRAA